MATEVAGGSAACRASTSTMCPRERLMNRAPRLHELQFGATDQVGGGLLAVHVQNDVGFAQASWWACGVAQGEALAAAVVKTEH